MSQFALPGTATAADILSGKTASSGAGFNFTGTMPAQGSPVLYPGGSIPAGNYTGGSVAAIKVASGSVTSSAATSSFTLLGGTTISFYTVTLPIPTGLNQLLSAYVGNYAWSAPDGYADGENSTVLATAASSPISQLIAGGALAVSASGIVIPAAAASTAYGYAIYYV